MFLIHGKHFLLAWIIFRQFLLQLIKVALYKPNMVDDILTAKRMRGSLKNFQIFSDLFIWLLQRLAQAL